MAVYSVIKPEMRDTFYEILNSKGIDGAVQRFFPISLSDKMIEKSKLILKKKTIYSGGYWIRIKSNNDE